MNQSDYIAQPTYRTTLDSIQGILASGQVMQFDAAVAYITTSGTYDLFKRVGETLPGAWAALPKRWLTSFDYCRTDPVALEYIKSDPNSSIRVHDADFCLSHRGSPRTPFHPKSFMIRTNQRDFVLAGSGNMSRSGLSRGFEAGLVVSSGRGDRAEDSTATAILEMRRWFEYIWRDATPLTDRLLGDYAALFEGGENLRAPNPTEDDVASTDTGRTALSSKELQRLRVCRNFWIEAGNITKNRGQNLPGNQLMMKRLSRVFFGFGPESVPENTHIGDIEIRFNGGPSSSFSLTYSDNKMDKLVLPIPGAGGPPTYDNQYLLFSKWKPGGFDLTLGSRAMKNVWQKKSSAISGYFRMSSGREWGVF